MKRFRRVAELWNWLPAFRGVAEHESIHGAATVLGVSPSSLSRTVRLLEDAFGAELFVRLGGGLKLTPIGTELLGITRDAMRKVDDCIVGRDAVLDRRAGPVFVGVTSSVASVALAAALLDRQPLDALVTFHVGWFAEDAVEDELLRGDLDLAVSSAAAVSAQLLTEVAGTACYGVYAARGHDLTSRADRIAPDDLAELRFVASRQHDGWPPEKRRSVAVFTDSLELTLAVCERSDLLCVLPDLLFAQRALGDRFTRLCDAASATTYVVRRKPLPNQNTSVLDELVVSLRRAFSA